MRADAPVEPAVGEHPLDLVGEHEQRRHRRRVVGLVLARVVERRGDRQELGDPAVGRRAAPRRARSRRGSAARATARRRRRSTSAARSSRRRSASTSTRQAAGAGRGVDEHERVAGVRGAHDVDHHAGRGLVVRPGEDVGGRVARAARARRRARRCTTIGSARNGAPAVTDANFWENSPKRQVQGALADEAGGGGVPEGGRPAVAEDDLVVRRAARRARADRPARDRRRP